MLQPRIVPVLLISEGALVKTQNYKNRVYVGDPLNAVRIFNDKLVDELVVIDIDASIHNQPPNLSLLRRLASECRMPLCYAGGISSITEIESIIKLGIEKVALGTSLVTKPDLVRTAVSRVGSQSIVAIVDCKKNLFSKHYHTVFLQGRKKTGMSPLELINSAIDLGVGEILLHSVDRDGTLLGYDYDLIDSIFPATKRPISILGGASSYDELKVLINRYGIVGACAGSIFTFKGKYKAVLLQYPTTSEKEYILSSYTTQLM